MPHIVVVGAGVFGTWTAAHLLDAGARVTLVEAYSPGHSRSSSGDESRIIRCGYGADEIYSRFAMRSLRLWRDVTTTTAEQPPMMHRCGVLWLAPEGDAYTAATQATLERGRYPLQVLDAAALAERYPHLSVPDVTTALFEPDCGVIMARRAVAALAARLVKREVALVRARVGPLNPPQGPLKSIQRGDGREIKADMFVFACGAWLPKVFPPLLTGRIRPTRQVVLYFGTPPGDERFGPQHTPAWVDFEAGIYGSPEIEGRGLKVGIDRHGAPFDPDTDDRVADVKSVAAGRKWLERRFPAMAGAPLVESRVCQYENTSNGDFLIDRHPDHDNVWIVGGGSGHGFKHGPAVGEYAAGLIMKGGDAEPRFSLLTKDAEPRRSVF